ncbi:unnamed protein product [Notodromas monacha]|uniref:C2H2-type domain-containing protein n=1 Tax=Notodromas monacha TaxID=399045 RepID=A0A7R9GIG7_9CRUS|nr:unnamed protein product [Notodromas monacha]CAG0921754.1 unnamed protein product [Notodromas monacha]
MSLETDVLTNDVGCESSVAKIIGNKRRRIEDIMEGCDGENGDQTGHFETILGTGHGHFNQEILKCYSCNRCVFRTSSKSNFESHLHEHFAALPFGCEACKYRSNDCIWMQRHILNLSESDPAHRGAKVQRYNGVQDLPDVQRYLHLYSSSIPLDEMTSTSQIPSRIGLNASSNSIALSLLGKPSNGLRCLVPGPGSSKSMREDELEKQGTRTNEIEPFNLGVLRELFPQKSTDAKKISVNGNKYLSEDTIEESPLLGNLVMGELFEDSVTQNHHSDIQKQSCNTEEDLLQDLCDSSPLVHNGVDHKESREQDFASREISIIEVSDDDLQAEECQDDETSTKLANSTAFVEGLTNKFENPAKSLLVPEKISYTKPTKRQSRRRNLRMFNCEDCLFSTDSAHRWKPHVEYHKSSSSGKHKCDLCSFRVRRKRLIQQHLKRHHGYRGRRISEETGAETGTNGVHDFLRNSAEGSSDRDSAQNRHCPAIREGLDENHEFAANISNLAESGVEKAFVEGANAMKAGTTIPFLGSRVSLAGHVSLPRMSDILDTDDPDDASERLEDGSLEILDVASKESVFELKEVLDVEQDREKHKRQSLQCPHCDFSTSFLRMFTRHIVFHNEDHPGAYKCTLCNFRINRRDSFERHTQLHHLTNQHGQLASSCELILDINPDCDIEQDKLEVGESNKAIYSDQTKETSTVKKLIKSEVSFCQHCPDVFRSTASLKSHLKCHDELREKFACEKCTFSCSESEELIQHVKVHSEEQAKLIVHFMKEYSGKTAYPPTRYHRELAALLSLKPPGTTENREDKLCPLKSVKGVSPRSDFFVSSGEIPLWEKSAPVKPRESPGTEKCSTNVKGSVAESAVETFSCSKCPSVFTNKLKLDLHSQRHGSNGRYPCKLCDYSSPNPRFLDKHVVCHGGAKRTAVAGPEKKQGCSTSRRKKISDLLNRANGTMNEKYFAQLACLTVCRMNEHGPASLLNSQTPKGLLGIKTMYHCARCPYATVDKFSLAKHTARHSANEAKPGADYVCKHCDYRGKPNVLQNHQKLHVISPPELSLRCDLSKLMRVVKVKFSKTSERSDLCSEEV